MEHVKNDSFQNLLAQLFGCLSGPDGKLFPTCEAAHRVVDRNEALMTLKEVWKYSEGKLLTIFIARAGQGEAPLVTVSVNEAEVCEMEESEELFAFIREKVALLNA